MNELHELLPHQQQALDYAMPKDRIALFMEMRLGKTVVAIRWAKARAKRILLIAPRTTLLGKTQWEGELSRESQTVISLPRLKKKQWPRMFWEWKVIRGRFVRQQRPGWFLVNYEALLHRPDILRQRWDAIIIDESTRIRNPKAKITKMLLRETHHIPYRAMLTGLPNPESSADYFCQFAFLHGEFMDMDNYWAWRHRYFHLGWPKWNWQPIKGTRDKIMSYVHDHAFVLQRKVAGVGSEKIRSQVRVDMNPAQKKAMKVMRREYALAGRETKWVTVVHHWMQRLAGGWHPTITDPPELMNDAKLKALAKIVRRTAPVVVWFRFNHEIESAYDYLRKHAKKRRIAYVHGAMKDSKQLRVKYQEAFQDGKLDAILLQVKLGKYGWNLSRADHAVYYSNSYEFEDRSQSEDRIIHLKKRHPVYYIDLVTRNSTDEDVVDALSEKRITARQFGRRVQTAILRRLKKAA